MKALITRGKFTGKEVEVSQWCNDWFMLDPRKNEDLTEDQKAEIHRNPFSPTSLAFNMKDWNTIVVHKNNGTLFDQFEKREMDGRLGAYEYTFKKKTRPKVEERKFLTVLEALKLLPKGGEVHTFLNAGSMLIGADWSRKTLEKTIKEAESREIGGEFCMGMGHGLVVMRKGGTSRGDLVFIKHDEEAIKKFL